MISLGNNFRQGALAPKFKNSSKHRINVVLIFTLLVQILSWHYLSRYQPRLGIFSDPPTIQEARFSAMGDTQFYFRYLGLGLQNSGDSFGRYTPFREYDYVVLKKWLMVLDDLDPKSNFLPSLASYYYSNTQNAEDVRYIIEYLEYTYDKDPKNKWWWLGQATILASQRLKDKNLAIRLAIKLSNTPLAKLPRWAQQMPAIIMAGFGERDMALAMIKDLANRYNDYSQAEINFMNYFIRKRLGFINEKITKEPTMPNRTGWYME